MHFPRETETGCEREKWTKKVSFVFLAERFCGVENCLKCSEVTSSRCEECLTGYVLSREDGLCSGKTDPTVSTGTPDRGDGADSPQDSASDSGLSDFVIAGK